MVKKDGMILEKLSLKRESEEFKKEYKNTISL